jgi:hypothetical protein
VRLKALRICSACAYYDFRYRGHAWPGPGLNRGARPVFKFLGAQMLKSVFLADNASLHWLKGIFSLLVFFHQSVSPQPQSIPLKPFQIFSKLHGDIRSSRLTTGVGVVDTCGK